jgi:flagellar motor protein MotB
MDLTARNLRGSLYRWRIAFGFCAIATFTVIVGFHLPLRREAARLRVEQQRTAAERASAQHVEALAASEHAANSSALAAARAENQRLTQALSERASAEAGIQKRIEKLKDAVTERFAPLVQAKQIALSSAGDRVSVAVALPVLFPEGRSEVGKDGRVLLCQLASSIMAHYGGQIRVTGYYGKGSVGAATPARGYATTWELSAARAASSTAVLEQGCGASQQRFLAVAYGPRAAGPLGPNVALEFALSEDT